MMKKSELDRERDTAKRLASETKSNIEALILGTKTVDEK
jgi:hypothetical protein